MPKCDFKAMQTAKPRLAGLPAGSLSAVGGDSIIPAMPLLFPLVQIVYWLALSTWFGGVLFLAIAAPIIFRTVRESDPLLPTVLSVNLEGQHSTLLAGSIVSNLIGAFIRIELFCAAAVLVCLVVQLVRDWQDRTAGVARAAMFTAAVVFTLYNWRIVWPRIRQHRAEYIEHADEPEIANPAREQFDRYHRESVILLMIVLATLLGMIMFSTSLSQARAFISQ